MPGTSQPERSPVRIMGPVRVDTQKLAVPRRFVASVRDNTKLNKCCRNVEASAMEYFDTDGNGEPDLMVITCNECGRRQFRVAGGGMGDPKGRLQGV